MANYASMIGEAIGHLIEAEVQNVVKEAVKGLDCYVDIGGARPGIRKGKKTLLVNDTGNQYQIDTVVEDKVGNPIVLIECKYIRYKKHNRDKASWTCVAHYKIRTTQPTIKKSIAVLIGDWTEPSKRLMRSFGVEIIEIPFKHLHDILAEYGVVFKWAEGDTEIAKNSWFVFNVLSKDQKEKIARDCVAIIADKLKHDVAQAIQTTDITIRNISQIELLIKTNQEEFVLKKFKDVGETIAYLLSMTSQKQDVGDIIKR
jgi:hypothetical protein